MAEWLESQYGYRIIVRNYRSRFGEVDLIAEEAGVLCFIEVRSRTTSRYGTALETISYEKRRRIARTAHLYLIVNNLESKPCRFDVVTIQDDKPPHLLRDAFHVPE